MTIGVVHALVERPGARSHVPGENIDAVTLTPSLDRPCNAQSYRQNPADDCRGQNPMLGETKTDRPPSQYLGLQLLGGHAMQETFSVHAPRTQNPILPVDRLEHADKIGLVAAVQVDRSADLARVVKGGDFLLEGDQVSGGQ